MIYYLVVQNYSNFPQPVVIRIRSVGWILIISKVKHFHYMHKPMMCHDF